MFTSLQAILQQASWGQIFCGCLIIALCIIVFVYQMLLSDSEDRRYQLLDELDRYKSDNWQYQKRLQDAKKQQYAADKQIEILANELISKPYSHEQYQSRV